VKLDIYYRTGVEAFANTTNSEEIVYFMGMTKEDLLARLTGQGKADMGEDLVAALFRDGGCS
jgi:hypothetical protein